MTPVRHRPDQDILDDLVPLLVQAYEAGRWYPQRGDHNEQARRPDWYHPADLERRIATLWAEARAAGLTPRRIASAARIPGREVFRWITDRRELLDAHIAEVHHAERELARVRLDRALLARTLLDPGPGPSKPPSKVEVAALFGVSRPALDEWLRQLAASWSPTPVAGERASADSSGETDQ